MPRRWAGSAVLRASKGRPSKQAAQASKEASRTLNLQNFNNFNNANLSSFVDTTTITIAAGNKKRYQTISNVSGTLVSYATTAPGAQTFLAKWNTKYDFSSQSPFKLTLIYGITENGNEPVAGDFNYNQDNNVIDDTFVTESYQYKVLGTFEPKLAGDGKYHCIFNLDLTKQANRWLEDFYKKEMSEISPGALVTFVGVIATGIATQVITGYNTYDIRYAVKPRYSNKSFL